MLKLIGVVSFSYIESTGITHFEIEVLANVANNRWYTKKPWTVLHLVCSERTSQQVTHNQKQSNNNQKSYVTRPTAPQTKMHTIAVYFCCVESWTFIQI